jgi:site-specific DNA-cytosine methylase
VQPKNHVDTTKPTEVTHLSLCTGYGGIDLGLARVVSNLRTVAYCEREAAAIELLLSRMEGGQLDAAPIWTDLRTFPWEAFSDRVDILSGGYPCQPFSAAGKRLGSEDERHLWPAIADGIRILRPRVCFFENVEGHISIGLREVIEELEGLGYRTAWGIFSAAEVGAPHQRKRVFIMAHRINAGLERHAWNGEGINRQGWFASQQDGPACQSSVCVWPSRPSEPQHWWEPPRVVGDNRQAEPKVGGGIDGAPDWLDYVELCHASDNRTDELRMLGNGVVPATAAKAFVTLMEELL